MESKDTHLSFTLRSVEELDALRHALVGYEEKHLRRCGMRWMNFVLVYFDLKTCLDELIANIFRHGYRELPVVPQVVVEVRGDQEGVTVEVSDNATPFDITAHPLATDQEVVLGIGLIRKLVDRVEHQALADGGNRVTIYRRAAD